VARPSLWHGHPCGTAILVARPSLWHGHPCGTTIPVARPSLWHDHPCGTAILVARPSLWHDHPCGTAIFVARPSLWHGHPCGTAILVARPSWPCFSWAGSPCHKMTIGLTYIIDIHPLPGSTGESRGTCGVRRLILPENSGRQTRRDIFLPPGRTPSLPRFHCQSNPDV